MGTGEIVTGGGGGGVAHIQIVTTTVDSRAYVVNFSETILLIYYGCECLIARSVSSFVFGASRKST